MVTSISIKSLLKELANPLQAKNLQRFFKTGPGQYGEGDVFWGLTMPQIRSVVQNNYRLTSLEVAQELLQDPIHEVRMYALLLLVYKFPQASELEQKEIFDFYTHNAKYINNWDLVDVTCTRIVGAYLFKRDRKLLFEFAKTGTLWEKRIAMVSSMYFISHGDFTDSLKLAKGFLNEKHDLMHKAVGWSLREIYKRDPQIIINFLNDNKSIMPRTALRYTIERMPETQRQFYLSK